MGSAGAPRYSPRLIRSRPLVFAATRSLCRRARRTVSSPLSRSSMKSMTSAVSLVIPPPKNLPSSSSMLSSASSGGKKGPASTSSSPSASSTVAFPLFLTSPSALTLVALYTASIHVSLVHEPWLTLLHTWIVGNFRFALEARYIRFLAQDQLTSSFDVCKIQSLP